MLAPGRCGTLAAALVTLLAAGSPTRGLRATTPDAAGAGEAGGESPRCIAPSAPSEPPTYYAFPLVSTKRVAGTGLAAGTGHVTFARSPFGIALNQDGSYQYDVSLSIEGLRPPPSGAYTVWLTTPTLDRIRRAGLLGADGTLVARAEWNKFLVVVTLEPGADPEATSWSGPIVLRGMSRSGMMHTMAGHGPFEQENCAAFGY